MTDVDCKFVIDCQSKPAYSKMNLNAKKLCNVYQQHQSESNKEKVNRLLNEVKELSEVEKLLFYLSLPTGVQREIKDLEVTPRSEVTEANNWIKSHFQPDKELCLPKQEVYDDYLLYCDKHSIKHVGREDLGKLMKTIYPSVTARRLGTRGQTKHCYGGLTKRNEVSSPTLPNMDTEPSNNNNFEIKQEENMINNTEMVKASSSLVCEWAEKLLNQEFVTINDIAEHLVRNSYVNCNSVAAYTVLSQVQKFKEDNKLEDYTVIKPHLSKQSSSNSRSAKQQLQLKLQEKERLREQKKKLDELRCAVTGEPLKTEESNNSGSGDTATVSCDASMSSDTTSNIGLSNKTSAELHKSATVQKILPKPPALVLPTSSSQKQQPLMARQSQKQQQSQQGKPLLIMSPTPNSGQYAPMILVSPMNTNQQILLPLTATAKGLEISTKQGGVITTTTAISNSNVTNSLSTAQSQLLQNSETEMSDREIANNHSDMELTSISETNSMTVSPALVTENDTSGRTAEDCKTLLDALLTATDYTSQKKPSTTVNSNTRSSVLTNGISSSTVPVIVSGSVDKLVRSQSLPAGLVNITADNVITDGTNTISTSKSNNQNNTMSSGRHVDNTKTSTKERDSNILLFQQNIKQEDGIDCPTTIVWNIPIQDSDQQNSGSTMLTLPVQTIDPSAISKLGIHDNNDIELSNNQGIISPIESPQLTPTQSSKGGCRKNTSKTVSSLLKEQRVKVDSPEVGGKNRYVNDNRPVAQILKELREKKKTQPTLNIGAMQNLSFTEEKIPKEVNEQSVKTLKEKIAREAVVMKKAHAINFGVKSSGIGNKKEINNSTIFSKPESGNSRFLRQRYSQQKVPQRNTQASSINNEDSDLNTKNTFKFHQLALRDMVNKTIFGNDTEDIVKDTKNGVAKSISHSSSVISSTKENMFLKKYLESSISSDEDAAKSHLKNVSASMNPKLASMLANNNNEVKPSDDGLMAGLLESIDKFTNDMGTNDSNCEPLYSGQQIKQSNLLLSQDPLLQVQDGAVGWNPSLSNNNDTCGNENNYTMFSSGSSDSNVFESQGTTTSDVMNNIAMQNMLSSYQQQQRCTSSRMETNNTAFMPIQSVEEGNIVSPVKPQAVIPNDLNGTNQGQQQCTTSSASNTTMFAKLKALLSTSPTPNNYETTQTDWLSRQNSSFVPYNQSYSNQTDQMQQTLPSMDVLNSNDMKHKNLTNNNFDFQPNNSQYRSRNTISSNPNSNDSFSSTNTLEIQKSTHYHVKNTISSNPNSNDGFASMEGVRPPSKRCMDFENFDKQGFSSKRSRHLSDQTNRRSRRSNVFIPPLQPLIPQDRTPSHESLTPMPSPSSSHGSSYGQYPPESPFSPEVHQIMSSSNTSDFYTNEFSGVVGNNTYRSMSVPVQNFMQNDLDYNFGNNSSVGLIGVEGNNYIQSGNNQLGIQDNRQYIEMQPSPHTMTNNNRVYLQQSEQQIQQQQEDLTNNSSPYNNARKNLIQILESRLAASTGFQGDASQNLRGDHMISGASVKPSLNMRHKLGETLDSVMLHNPVGNNDIPLNDAQYLPQNTGQYTSNTAGNGLPNPTPPGSHPPTPVDFSNGEQTNHHLSSHHQQQQCYTVMSQNMGRIGNGERNRRQIVTIETPAGLVETMGSQESRDNMVATDAMFNMADNDVVANGADISGNTQFVDFLRIL